MSINQELTNLYLPYEERAHFVRGGVINEPKYINSNKKVLMLLKEVNNSEQQANWSLIDLINNQIETNKFLPLWKRVGEWNFGIQNGFPSYQVVSKSIHKGLESIATTNLKKSGGHGESNFEEIKVHANSQKDLWTKEIEIIAPDIVICGGTYSIVKDILGMDTQVCGSGALYGKALDTTFIDYYHPAYRVSPRILYAYLKETIIHLN